MTSSVFHKAPYLLCLFFAFLVLFATAQKADSLKNILKSNNHDTTKMFAYLSLRELEQDEKLKGEWNEKGKHLAEKLLNSTDRAIGLAAKAGHALTTFNTGADLLNSGESTKAIEYFIKALKLLEELHDKKSLANLFNNLGIAYYNVGNISSAIESYNKAMVLMEEMGIKDGLASACYNIALIYKKQGDIPRALENLRKGNKLFEELNIPIGIAYTLIGLGEMYIDQNDCDKAIENLNKCIPIFEKLNDPRGFASVYNDLGSAYRKLKQTDKALFYHAKGLELREKAGYKSGIAMSLINMGQIYAEIGQIDKAFENYKKSLVLRRESDDKWGISNSFSNLSSVFFKKKQYALARTYTDSALVIASDLGYPESISGCERALAKIDSATGSYLGAYEHYKKYIFFKDSTDNEKTRKASLRSQVNFEFDKKEALLKEQQENERKVATEKDKLQRVIIASVVLGLVLLLIFSVFILRSLRQNKRSFKIISEQKTEVEKQKELIETKSVIIEEKQKEILDSIRYAKRIQNAILPSDRDIKQHLPASFILYKPKDIVAGDFYWLEHKNGSKLLAVADCTGHGVPGAMVSVVCNNALNRSVREYNLTDPGEILTKTREIVIEEFEKSDEEVKDGMDIALCSLNGTTIKFAGANNPLWIIRNGEIIEIAADKQPIGKFDKLIPYTTHEVEIKKGDTCYIFSDGYADQFGGESGKKLKVSALRKLLLSVQNENMEAQKTSIENAFEKWKGNLEQIDDVCMIGLRF